MADILEPFPALGPPTGPPAAPVALAEDDGWRDVADRLDRLPLGSLRALARRLAGKLGIHLPVSPAPR